jgi:YVTN family beta-propeller protein
MMTHTNEPTAVRKGLTTVSLLASTFILVAAAATPAEAQTRAYVANSDADLVTVIETASNALGTPIAVGSAPRHVTISKDASRVYVANTGSNSVSVIDTKEQQVIAAISLKDQPSSIAVTPNGDRLFVLGATGLLEVIDTTSDAVVASVALAVTNGRIAITPDGTRAYIAAGTVTVIDTATNEVLATIVPEVTAVPGVANFAVAVAITPDGTRAYVPFITYSTIGIFGFSAAGGVAVIDTATNKVTKSIDLFSLPGSITLTADGSRAFVSIDAFWAQTGYGAAFVPGQWVATIDTATDANLGFTDVAAGRPARRHSGQNQRLRVDSRHRFGRPDRCGHEAGERGDRVLEVRSMTVTPIRRQAEGLRDRRDRRQSGGAGRRAGRRHRTRERARQRHARRRTRGRRQRHALFRVFDQPRRHARCGHRRRGSRPTRRSEATASPIRFVKPATGTIATRRQCRWR